MHSVDDKTKIIENIPQIAGHSKIEMAQIMTYFKEILSEDRSFVVSVVGALSELPLSEQQRVCV